MKTVFCDDFHKYEIDGNNVQFMEKVSGSWRKLGQPEKWSDELIQELIEDYK